MRNSLKNCFKIIMFSMFLVGAGLSKAESQNDPNARIVAEVVKVFMQKNNIPGVAVELYTDGKPHAYYFGYSNREKKTPVSGKTIFELGSVSKIMTSLLITQQVDFAFMSLDDPVTKYVKNLPSSFNKVKLVDLATHTAGLPFDLPGNIQTETQLQQYYANWRPEERPGEAWNYSNVGIGLLGSALETFTTRNYEKLYRSHISYPLGMEAISFHVPDKLMPNYAQGYNAEDAPVQPVNVSLLPAAYGLKATASDMQRFLGAAIGIPGTPERILYPMRMTQLTYVKAADKSQGLGWFIHPLANRGAMTLLQHPQIDFNPSVVDEVFDKPNFDGNVLLDKTGSTQGFRSYIAVIPNKKSGVVILANKNPDNQEIVAAGREILFKLTHS